jgi:hypothetical protein
MSELQAILVKLGITKFSLAEDMTEDTIENVSSDFKVIRTIREAGGLVIPAHIDLDSGLVGRLKGGGAVQETLEKTGCSILEIRNKMPEIIFKEINTHPTKYAIISGSDAHKLSEIGAKAIWIKMDAPNLYGLSQLAFEPLNRLQKVPVESCPKAKILGMYSNGGLLGEQVYAFNDDLNCIIGGRGSGKSAIIDYLRFVFGGEPLDEDLQHKFRKRLVDLIRESTTVYVLIENSNGDLWLYERKFSHIANTRANVTSTSWHK